MNQKPHAAVTATEPQKPRLSNSKTELQRTHTDTRNHTLTSVGGSRGAVRDGPDLLKSLNT